MSAWLAIALASPVVLAAFWFGWYFGGRFGRKSHRTGRVGDAPEDPAAPPGPSSAGRSARLLADVPAPDRDRPGIPAALRAEPLEARRVGRYRLERELGRGSMGAVHLARPVDGGSGPVALKTMALAREFGGTALVEARARFFREAEVAGRLRHPDIVRIHEVGEDRGVAFIAMEYVSGEDLSHHTLPGALLPVPEVLRTLARVAEALSHAHAQGVVHRDLKPANVMLDRATGAVKVTDFGIAHVADACRTRTGLVLGTPSFMSPEQMTGGRVDGRSDLYSLGVVLYQLLTGTLPHASDSMAEMLHAIVNATAPDIRVARPELSEPLARVVARALEKRVEARHADGHALARELAALAAETPAPRVD